ncbi:hypothetical protein AXYL_04048 [Achromobacter xylosoxidans A8]|uniref:Uncharacterized protein n=1 Tax=Achromobacter xylosoxidans (strain A8) TaxID=762376 RepID=E3HTS8_ACHXA|nr:hypothetical protein [Achromobacter xylosoxidans]ADP17368.1 hypothetical protein AXYL_04048 [Achromobacter xylosoxidans A8]
MKDTAIGIDPAAPGSELTTIQFLGCKDFEAFNAAEDWCRKNDIAMGSMERDCPIGLMWGADAHEVSKWTRMTRAEQDAMDGRLTGNKRHGPITITIMPRTA